MRIIGIGIESHGSAVLGDSLVGLAFSWKEIMDGAQAVVRFCVFKVEPNGGSIFRYSLFEPSALIGDRSKTIMRLRVFLVPADRGGIRRRPHRDFLAG